MKLYIVLRSTNKLAERLDYYGRYHPSILTIQRFIDFGKKNVSAKNSFLFLRKEIPVRLANIMKEINLLPEQLLQMPSVQTVVGWYEESFRDVLEFENVDANSSIAIARFTKTIDNIQTRHATVVETMAHGVMEMKDQAKDAVPQLEPRIQYFLDRFYLMRISIRLLIHQHLLLYGDWDNHSPHIGCFDPHCDVLKVAKDAYSDARHLCKQYYNSAPGCQFKCVVPYEKPDDHSDSVIMTYVPAHLHYILFELFKNALRAVVEFQQNSRMLPPVQLLVCKGREDVTFKMSDEGGGVSHSDVDKLFQYMYSSAPRPPPTKSLVTAPLAGYGYGLPLSRLYAKHFNGDLWLNSVHGYGTDAMICLKVLPKDASELLPIYNRTSLQRYASAVQVADWSEPISSHMDNLNDKDHRL